MEDSDCDFQGSRLGDCEVCGRKYAQYTCPRCEIKTCCLECVKIHKKELECSGDRDKVGFVPLSKFNNLTLLSDYRFLEDVSRTIDNCRRNPNKKYTRFNRPLPPHLYRLRKEAFSRRTNIQFLPQHFTRHQENTTFLNFETKIIFWRLQFVFYHAENLIINIERCSENERLSTVLSNFIDFEKCEDVYKKALKFYHAAGLPGIEVLLKAESVKNQPAFFQLDVTSTIRENFEDRIIIEYPVLFVIFKSHKHEFDIMDPDMALEYTQNKVVGGKFSYSNFMPYTYFDTVSYSAKPTAGDEAFDSIRSSANKLKKYFSCDKSDDEACIKAETIENEITVGKKPVKLNSLNIPYYESLVKQNN